jgi:hypothetical protein
MRGPLCSCAINGHSRNYYAIHFEDNTQKYIGGFTIFSDVIVGTVAGVSIEITRKQAAKVLCKWREKGYNIFFALDHFKPYGRKTCVWCDGTDTRFQPQLQLD